MLNRVSEKFTTSLRAGVGAMPNIRSILLVCTSSTELPQVVSRYSVFTPRRAANISAKSGPKPSHLPVFRFLLK
ncbi:hypothetical protein D3C72_1813350 [compost metagenome]